MEIGSASDIRLNGQSVILRLNAQQIWPVLSVNAPEPMIEAQWDALMTGIHIMSAPASDHAIRDYQYRINAGSGYGPPISLGANAPGFVPISLPTGALAQIRAVSSGPDADWSDEQLVGNKVVHLPKSASGWTTRWRIEAGNLTFQSSPERWRLAQVSSGRTFFSLDGVEGISLASVQDFEMTMDVEFAGSEFEVGILARGSGSASSETGVAMRFLTTGGNPNIHRTAYNNGAANTETGPLVPWMVGDARYLCRVSFAGTAIKAKVWPHAAPEPAAWTYEATSSSPVAAGRLGLFVFNNGRVSDLFGFGIGLNGARAPLPL